MASPLLLRPILRSPLALGLGFTAAFATQQLHSLRRPLLCDASPAGSMQDAFRTYSDEARVPVFKNGRPNPAAYRQISSGSIIGLLAGLAVSTFSKTLALLFGLLVFGVQFAASKGINVLPTSRIQQYVKGINLRSAIEDNAAFKLSFGATFILASLAEF